MKRFVSYLYSIYNNQKIHNSGFARIELRTGRNRIDIHLQESGYSGKTGMVYLFVRKKENIHGISIGNINFRNNQADFRYEQPEENIGQTSWQIMQMNGIVILIDDKITFLSQWDEVPVDTTRFEIWKQEQEEKEEMENQAGDTIVNDVQDTEASHNVQTDQAVTEASHNVQTNQAVNNDSAAMQMNKTVSNTGEQSKQNIENGLPTNSNGEDNVNLHTNKRRPYHANYLQPNQNRRGNQNTKGPVNRSQQGQNTPTAENNQAPAQPSNIRTAELQPQPNTHQWEQTWRYMLRIYPVLNQFADKDNALCVRIEIKDVRLLPEKYWSVVNNSFLLHGFFNYRYLIFGRIGQNWIIGIPGIYQNQEHAMASIFGFPDFLAQVQKNERGEQPGYWYRILEI